MVFFVANAKFNLLWRPRVHGAVIAAMIASYVVSARAYDGDCHRRHFIVFGS